MLMHRGFTLSMESTRLYDGARRKYGRLNATSLKRSSTRGATESVNLVARRRPKLQVGDDFNQHMDIIPILFLGSWCEQTGAVLKVYRLMIGVSWRWTRFMSC